MMEDELRENLRSVASAYVAATSLALSTIGMRAVKDARFFDRLSEGKGFTVRTYDLALQWFSDSWPEKAEWPSDIDRPAPSGPSPAPAAADGEAA